MNGVLVIGYDYNSNGRLPPHLCMTFDTLLDLANYQSGDIMTRQRLNDWYNKYSKNKLIYSNQTEQDMEVFNFRQYQ